MLLEWPEHDKKLTEGLTHLHQLNAFHDVTLSAEGKQIKAHRVVLASVSSYFKELLLSDTDDRFPIVFLKDVNFSDLESLIKFIYTGKTEVPATNLTSCTNLAETLGVKGFVTKIHTSRSPVKRKSTDNNHATSHHSPYFVKNSSEPISLPSHQNNANENLPTSEISQLKRRKVHSLGNLITDAYVVTPPHPFKTSTNLLQESRKSITTKLLIPKSPASPVKKSQHASYNSCPVESPTTSSASESSNRMLPHASALNNISFDSTFMDPSEMASKGANILHHLAMWMLEESKSTKTGSSSNILETASSAHSSSKLPPPPPPNNSLNSNPGSKRRVKGDSFSGDRPDSGFDSKDEEDVRLMPHNHQVSEAISEEAGIRTASSGDASPEVTSGFSSRQAPIRQPVKLRKRRLQ